MSCHNIRCNWCGTAIQSREVRRAGNDYCCHAHADMDAADEMPEPESSSGLGPRTSLTPEEKAQTQTSLTPDPFMEIHLHRVRCLISEVCWVAEHFEVPEEVTAKAKEFLEVLSSYELRLSIQGTTEGTKGGMPMSKFRLEAEEQMRRYDDDRK